MKKILSIILGITLLASFSFAAVDWQRFEFFENSGGLNDQFSPILIEDNEASNLQNVVFTKAKHWKTRDGFKALNTDIIGSDITCTGGIYYRTIKGVKHLVAIFSDGTIRKMDYNANGPDGTWDDITGSIIFLVTQNDLASFAIGEDTLIIEDGVTGTAPYKWTGSGNATDLGGSPPNASIVTYHKRHAFFAGDRDNPSILYFTDLGDIENSTTGLSGNVEIETNDGTIITALAPGFDALYIWKGGSAGRGSIWRLSGDDKDTFKLQRMVSDVGTLSPRSVALIGNSFFFIDSQGDTYIYDGAIGLRLISTKIEGTRDNLNFDRFPYISTVAFDKDYYISVSDTSAAFNNMILVFDTFPLAWTKFSGFHANALWVADNGSGQDMLVWGGYKGVVFKYPSGTNDDDVAIDMFYHTKKYSFPELRNPESKANKAWRALRVFCKQKGNNDLIIEPRVDFGSSGTSSDMNLKGTKSLFGTAKYGTAIYGGKNIIIERFEPDLEGDYFQILYSNNTKDEPIENFGWQISIETVD
ncbi:hypothetical protein LCGC14_0435040 [marine sediment metagenome]|uniref:Uncharacterized protein n=1 Tax=marine sediment metagenome TaxID=412755 RepID=A0A0F9T560_9ZZZZ